MTAARASRSPEELIATFGRRLRVLRLWNGLSEAEMARTLDISVRTLKRREAGTVGSRGMNYLMLGLAMRFEVSFDWLLDHEIPGRAYRDEIPLAPDGKPLSGQPLERFLS